MLVYNRYIGLLVYAIVTANMQNLLAMLYGALQAWRMGLNKKERSLGWLAVRRGRKKLTSSQCLGNL